MTRATAPACRVARPADPGWRPTPEAELAHLRLCWGRLYQIGYHAEHRQWVARFPGSGDPLIARSPLELRRVIRDDWNDRLPASGWGAGREAITLAQAEVAVTRTVFGAGL